MEKLTFHEWIYGDLEEDCRTAPDPWGFSMVRFYDPDTKNLDRAIANIESMDFVGFTDRLNQDINKLMDLIGISQRYNNARQNQVRRNFTISPKDRQHILDVRADDLRLVNHFRSKRGLRPYV